MKKNLLFIIGVFSLVIVNQLLFNNLEGSEKESFVNFIAFAQGEGGGGSGSFPCCRGYTYSLPGARTLMCFANTGCNYENDISPLDSDYSTCGPITGG